MFFITYSFFLFIFPIQGGGGRSLPCPYMVVPLTAVLLEEPFFKIT